MFGLLTQNTPAKPLTLGCDLTRVGAAAVELLLRDSPPGVKLRISWYFFVGLLFTSSPTFKAVSKQVTETKLQTSTSAIRILQGRRCATGSAEQVLPLQRGIYLLPSTYEMPPEVQGLKGEVKEPSLAVSSHSTQTKYTFYRAPLLTLRRVPTLLFA